VPQRYGDTHHEKNKTHRIQLNGALNVKHPLGNYFGSVSREIQLGIRDVGKRKTIVNRSKQKPSSQRKEIQRQHFQCTTFGKFPQSKKQSRQENQYGIQSVYASQAGN